MIDNIIVSIFNSSAAFGGQERFIEIVFFELRRRQIESILIGFPAKLNQNNEKPDKKIDYSYSVDLLNGNRALYMHGWRRARTDIRVYIQHSHVQDAQSHPARRWGRKILLRLLLMRMDIVIRVCKNALPDQFAPGKIHTIYNGISLPESSVRLVAARPFTLLMVGAVNQNKNQRLALQLLAQEPDLRLLIVGDGPERSALEQWARALGVDSRVRWTGFVDDPSPFYLQADALLILSAYEAFPYAMLEAMAHALPVVATRVGGIPEAITHEQDGLLLPARDLESLSAAVRRLQDNPQWRVQLGQHARHTVSERFTSEIMVDKLLDVISLTARKKGLIP